MSNYQSDVIFGQNIRSCFFQCSGGINMFIYAVQCIGFDASFFLAETSASRFLVLRPPIDIAYWDKLPLEMQTQILHYLCHQIVIEYSLIPVYPINTQIAQPRWGPQPIRDLAGLTTLSITISTSSQPHSHLQWKNYKIRKYPLCLALTSKSPPSDVVN